LEQARLATGATGAAIALVRGAEMVCRATTGPDAPDVGVCLDPRIGLSGSCIQTRQLQQCNDTETDPRVDFEACRSLGIRSIVVLPLMDGNDLFGVFEILSSRPNAFGELELHSLKAVTDQILESRRQNREPTATVPLKDIALDPMQPDLMAREIFLASGQLDSRTRRRDYRTGTLTAVVIALAVLLGWMLGRAGWNMAVNRAQNQILAAPEEVQAAAQETPDIPPASSIEEATAPAKPVRSSPASHPAPKPTAEVVERNDGLVMYEHGKVVFRMAPSEKTSPSANEADSIQTEATGNDSSPASPAQAPNQATNRYLLVRVEPEYPEEARQQHIQGPVVMNAVVGIDGSVRELKAISGDPQLAKAAADAVRQWRFQPHRLKDKPVEFEARITVNFILP
jgi:TonB family protein